jgi:hypothetical protein
VELAPGRGARGLSQQGESELPLLSGLPSGCALGEEQSHHRQGHAASCAWSKQAHESGSSQ